MGRLERWTSAHFESQGVSLRYLTSPSFKWDQNADLLVFVPGWASTPQTWAKFMPGLTPTFQVVYFETREKATCLVGKRDPQDLNTSARDVENFINFASQRAGRIFLVGASTGANLALLAAARLPILSGLVLITPHAKSPIPSRLRALDFMPQFVLPAISTAVTSLAGTSFLPSSLRQQRAGLIAAARASDLGRLRASARGWRTFTLRPDELGDLAIPTLVIGAANDEVHRADDARLIANMIPRALFRDQGNFASVHGRHTAQVVAEYCLSAGAGVFGSERDD